MPTSSSADITKNWRTEAESGLVTRTNFGMVKASVPRGCADANIPRNHLSKPLHSSSRGSQEGTTRASAIEADDAALKVRQH